MKRNMEKVRDTLHALNEAEHGVDGSKIYIYGEGWNFGEVANDARGVNATQLNLPGTGIGTFSDRLRDAVRGGGPFDNVTQIRVNQGFSNGLYYDPNSANQGDADELNKLKLYQDQIRVGMAGNLAGYSFVDRNGSVVTGAQVDYNGSPAGYTHDPQEVITYIEAHDNQTLWDINQYKLPLDTTMAERVRVQNLGNSIVLLSQGVPFFHAGQEMLRSKSLDRNSYNSGDWFNKLDFTYQSNNWGAGLPIPEGEAAAERLIQADLLGNPALKPGKREILDAVEHFLETLRIRKSSPLFRLRTAEEINQRVRFLNTGTNQIPGLLVMTLDDTVGQNLDPQYDRIAVVINASDQPVDFTALGLANAGFTLHPIQQSARDRVVRDSSFNTTTGTFSVPARTAAVFVE
jgi:pullulanase